MCREQGQHVGIVLFDAVIAPVAVFSDGPTPGLYADSVSERFIYRATRIRLVKAD